MTTTAMQGEMQQRRELAALAGAIHDYQLRREYSDSEMLRRFPGLGSTKTYKRILADDMAELDLDNQLANYRSAWALIESIGEDDAKAEDIYDDLYPVVQLRRVLLETMREAGTARVVLVQGHPGSGKSFAARAMMTRYGQRMLYIEASDLWGDNPLALLGAVLRAMGVRDLQQGGEWRLEAVVERLRATRRCVFVDEAHHLGPRCLNTVKTLVNQTPGEFVLMTLPTLWAKLERAAYEEARQLTTNRLAERIRLEGVREADVRRILERRLPSINGSLAQAARLLTEKARTQGNYAFVRDVARRVEKLCDGGEITQEMVAAAVAAETESR